MRPTSRFGPRSLGSVDTDGLRPVTALERSSAKSNVEEVLKNTSAHTRCFIVRT